MFMTLQYAYLNVETNVKVAMWHLEKIGGFLWHTGQNSVLLCGYVHELMSQTQHNEAQKACSFASDEKKLMNGRNHHKNAETFLNISLAMNDKLTKKEDYIHSNGDFDEQKMNIMKQKKELDAYLILIRAEKNLCELKGMVLEDGDEDE